MATETSLQKLFDNDDKVFKHRLITKFNDSKLKTYIESKVKTNYKNIYSFYEEDNIQNITNEHIRYIKYVLYVLKINKLGNTAGSAQQQKEATTNILKIVKQTGIENYTGLQANGTAKAADDASDADLNKTAIDGILKIVVKASEADYKGVKADGYTAATDASDADLDKTAIDGILKIVVKAGEVGYKGVKADGHTAATDASDADLDKTAIDGILKIVVKAGEVGYKGVKADGHTAATDASDADLDKTVIDGIIKITKHKYNTTTLSSGIKNIKSCDTLNEYVELMKNATEPLENIINIVAGYLNANYNYFLKAYFLLNNPEILFLYSTFDYKLMIRILNRNNFISDDSYKKACFIAMIVFEMWSMTYPKDANNIADSDMNKPDELPFYNQNYINMSSNPDYEPYKRAKRIHDLIKEINYNAESFMNDVNNLKYAVDHNAFEIEIPKRNLDNVIRPLNEIPEQQKNIEFNLNLTPINEKYHYTSSILPNSINGGVRRIKGGDEKKLKELKDSYDDGKLFNENGNKQIDQTRFLFDCLINANEKGASKCLTTLSISTAKVESYKIVETLPRATLVKLATVLGIQFSNGMIEKYDEWINRIKNETGFNDENKKLLDANGEVKLIGKFYKDNKIAPNATDDKPDGA